MNMRTISVVGVASAVGAGVQGCQDGPVFLKKQPFNKLRSGHIQINWHTTLTPKYSSDKLNTIHELSSSLAQCIKEIMVEDKFFTVIGGDHSCAIGTWSGVFSALNEVSGSLGLLWIDAHLDSHTFETTHSGNIHGMPLAALLGYGDPLLKEVISPLPKISPKNLCIIGARSFEQEEQALLHRLGVRIFYMDEINERGLSQVMQEAMEIVKAGTVGYGLSLDMDAIDPIDAPGVGTPESQGISAAELCSAIQIMQRDTKLLGIEIVEYNPHNDIKNKTAQLIETILFSLLKKHELTEIYS